MQPLRVGAALATIALVVACSGGGAGAGSGLTPQVQPNRDQTTRHIVLPQSGERVRRSDASGTLQDGSFESGGYTYWQQCGSVAARIDTYRAHTGRYSDLNGQVSTPEINGDSGLCQQVTVPVGGKITFWLYEGTNETSTTYSYQEADLLDSNGYVLQNLFTEAATTNGWSQRTYDVSAYAGTSVWLYFGVHADGYSHDYMYQYVDDVAWSNGATPTPSPTATPTAHPTPTPTVGPTATPTIKPTATPTTGPTATPTIKPTATPTIKPTATPTIAPTATPTPGGGPTPFPTPPGSGPHGGSCGTTCGVQRWHIKTLDDGDESKINWNPVLASVTTMRSFPVPNPYNQYNDTTRYAPYEIQAYTVRAVLVGWKTEADHDYHLVVADPNNPNNTMIVEPPDSTCSDACDSGFGSVYSALRSKLTTCFGQVPSSFTNFPAGVVVDLTGVPLFDAVHGQTGVAPNGIELHPLLNVTFVSGTSCT